MPTGPKGEKRTGWVVFCGGKEQEGGFQDRISAPDVSKEATPLGWCGERRLKPMFAGGLPLSNS
jgi:hypothetical protein